MQKVSVSATQPQGAVQKVRSRAGFDPRNEKYSVKGNIARVCFSAFLIVLLAVPSRAQEAAPMFPRIRGLDLAQVRALALKQSTSIALAQAKLNQAQAELKDQRNRFKLTPDGGIGFGVNPNNPNGGAFSNKVSFYLSLDLERLLQLNKKEREQARQEVEAQNIGKTDAQNAALKGVTAAWFSLRRAEAAVLAASRYRETANAIYIAADARFKAGQGELSGVLSGLRGTWESEDAYNRARQDVALACLDLAQASGYATAEEMEAALS